MIPQIVFTQQILALQIIEQISPLNSQLGSIKIMHSHKA